jgi:AcrR family transcriptional regulator
LLRADIQTTPLQSQACAAIVAALRGENSVARRSNDPSRVREKILKQATEEFARIGFEGARVDRIAERSRVSKNMLYYYFKSKEGLFVAALERMYQSLRDQQKDLVVRASDPVAAMAQLVHHTFHALKDNPSAIRLMNEENKHRAKYIRKSDRMRDLYNPLVETIRFILDRGVKDGTFRPGLDPTIVYLTLSSLCYHYLSNQFTLEIALDRDLGSEEAQQQWLDHVSGLVLLYCLTPATAISRRKPRRETPKRVAAPPPLLVLQQK